MRQAKAESTSPDQAERGGDATTASVAEPGSFAELAAILHENPNARKADIPRELRHRLGRELRLRGPGAILEAGELVVNAVRKQPSILPRKARRRLIQRLSLVASAPAATWCGVRILLDDRHLNDEAFVHFWKSDLTDDVRSQLVLWAFEAGVDRVRAGNVAAAALTSLTHVAPGASASATAADTVFAYLSAVAPNIGAIGWMPCLVQWATKAPDQVSDRSSKLWRALRAWWATNEHLLRSEHFDPLISNDIVPSSLRTWARCRKMDVLMRELRALTAQ